MKAGRERIYAFARSIHSAVSTATQLPSRCPESLDQLLVVTWPALSELAGAPRPTGAEASSIAEPNLIFAGDDGLETMPEPSRSSMNANVLRNRLESLLSRQHILVLRTDSVELPHGGGDVFNPGSVSGRAIIVRVKDATPLCSLPISARNSDEVSYTYLKGRPDARGSEATTALEKNLAHQYGSAVLVALERIGARVRRPAKPRT